MVVSKTKAPIFLLSAPRSGSTFFCSVLNEHSAILMPNEMYWFEKNRKKMGKIFSNKEKTFNFYRKLRAIRKNSVSSSKNTFDEIYRNSNNVDEFYYNMMNALCVFYEKKRWGDKITLIHNTKILPQIFEAYPKAKILYLIRDPRAVVYSMNKISFTLNSNNFFVNLVQLRNSYRQNDVIEKYMKKYSIKIIKYESLFEGSEEFFNDIFSFLGEKSEPVMVDKKRKKLERYYYNLDFKHEHHLDSIFDIDRKRSVDWEEGLDNNQIWLIQHVFGYEMSKFGYSTKNMNIKQITKLRLIACYLFYLFCIRSVEVVLSLALKKPVYFRKLEQFYFWRKNRF